MRSRFIITGALGVAGTWAALAYGSTTLALAKEQVLNLPDAERAKLSDQVLGLVDRLHGRHPHWVQRIDRILRQGA